jgi:glutathione S-transferase
MSTTPQASPELYQAEWCPFSHRVRMRLTELGVEFVARQVPADRERRDRMEELTGTRAIPTLVAGATVLTGADAIVAYLDATYPEGADAQRHRLHARADWPLWLELHGSAVAAGEPA